jgi:AcrR family transcriptional regulator
MNKIAPTKQRILLCAIELFASKGYVETSVRDIALAVGIKPASLYNHFSSKYDLLKFMMDDYYDHTRDIFRRVDVTSILQKNPTAEGCASCILSAISVLKDDYYRRLLDVIYQEQHRLELFKKHIIMRFFEIEEHIERIFDVLKKLNVIRNDANAAFWGNTVSSLLYAHTNRTTLGLGENSPDYIGMDLACLLNNLFDVLFKIHSSETDKGACQGASPKNQLPPPEAEATDYNSI